MVVRAETLHVRACVTLHARPAGRKTRGATRTEDIMSQWKLSPIFGSRLPDVNGHRREKTGRLDVEALEK